MTLAAIVCPCSAHLCQKIFAKDISWSVCTGSSVLLKVLTTKQDKICLGFKLSFWMNQDSDIDPETTVNNCPNMCI